MPNEKMLEIDLRRAFFVNARRTAGENDPLRRQLFDFLRRDIVPNDLGIDLALAHPPGDDLRVLRAEIENENSRMRRRLHGMGGVGGLPRGRASTNRGFIWKCKRPRLLCKRMRGAGLDFFPNHSETNGR